MDELDTAIKKAELERVQSETRKTALEAERVELEKAELAAKLQTRWWHISPTGLIQTLLGGAVAGFLVAGFAFDHFINISDLNKRNEEALQQRTRELEDITRELDAQSKQLQRDNEEHQRKIQILENEAEQLQARLDSRIEPAVEGSVYETDVWAYNVSEEQVDDARDYLRSKGYGVGSGGLLESRPSWLAPAPTVFYYHENAEEVARSIAADLPDVTGIDFDVRRGAGYGVARNKREVTFFIHLVPGG